VLEGVHWTIEGDSKSLDDGGGLPGGQGSRTLFFLQQFANLMALAQLRCVRKCSLWVKSAPFRKDVLVNFVLKVMNTRILILMHGTGLVLVISCFYHELQIGFGTTEQHH
jgi:hypothetical protein